MVRRTEPENPGSAREAYSGPTARIDWLAGRIRERDGHGNRPEAVWFTGEPKRCSPDAGFARAGYTDWHGDDHATKVARRFRDAADNGELVRVVDATYLIAKGSSLAQLRARGIDDFAAIHHFEAFHGLCRRIDLAVDVRHPEVTPAAIRGLFDAGRVQTRLNAHEFHGDRAARGETFYLRGNDQVVRVYDKTAERARHGLALAAGITRFELELHGDLAQRAFRALAGIAVSAWDAEFPSFVIGTILGKVRPLVAPCPQHHPGRIATWPPLAAALLDVTPVRLPRDELFRNAASRLNGKVLTLRNLGGMLSLMRSLMGREAFDDYLAGRTLSADDAQLLDTLQTNPAWLRRLLVDSGLLPTLTPAEVERLP